MAPKLVLVDNDMGIDDAWAMLALMKGNPDRVKVIAVTGVKGNTCIENVSFNNLYLLNLMKEKNVPYYVGARSPLIPPEQVKDDESQYYYGRNGLGDVAIPKVEEPLAYPQTESAVSAMHRIVTENKGEITIAALGPLTNIALAIRTYPDFVENVKEIFIMGGNFTARGNTTRCAEFNFHIDPEAAHIVLQGLGGKITILPWESCLRSTITFDWWESLKIDCGPVTKFIGYTEKDVLVRARKLGLSKYYITGDLLLAALLIVPNIINEVFTAHATVELAGFHTRGQLVIDHLQSNEPNIIIVKSVHEELYKEMLLHLKKFWCVPN